MAARRLIEGRMQHRTPEVEPGPPGNCEVCRRTFPSVTSGEGVHCRCDGTFVVHAAGTEVHEARGSEPAPCFKVGDRVRVTSAFREREGQEGEVVSVDPVGDVLCHVRVKGRGSAWCRASELVLDFPPGFAGTSATQGPVSSRGSPDADRLDWLDSDPGRLEDVRGHWNNVEGCRSVREAIDALRSLP